MLGALAVACLTVALLTGCSTEDAICGGGEYPVLAVGSTGRACAPNGQEPPAGYVRFPQGKVPEHVSDEWDTYWNTHTVDHNGKIVEVPGAG
ncbi:hypothetical protein ABZ721_04935 [Streptomyces sp. NPDC006733]|uniref:SCO0607 family lipoprotein n=1 Tax=Streptomyces sp. NPDC006733 TaxID=3155460 RepID=UPI003404626D